MAKLVIDTSAACKWVLPDEADDVSRQAFARLADGTHDGHVSVLWRWEVLNALRMSERRGRISSQNADAALVLIDSLPLQFDVPPNLHRLEQTLRLARAHQLTAYDAAHLELVLRINAQLLSYDKALVAAAKRCGIECIDTTPPVH